MSIVIAAHNEESVIGATLDAVIAETAGAEIVVVPNGCTDGTAVVARERDGVVVVELESGSKPLALNGGDAVATSFPRIYLDADIIVPRGGIEALLTELEKPGVLAAVPGRSLNMVGRPWLVRAHSVVHSRLPVFRDGLFGRGLIALSEEGRSRFDDWPNMVADDVFVDSLFASHEKAQVDSVTVEVETPLTTRNLLNRLERVRRGAASLRQAAQLGSIPVAVRPTDRWSWLRDVVLKDVRLVPAGLGYFGVTVMAELRARRRGVDALDWGRDESTR